MTARKQRRIEGAQMPALTPIQMKMLEAHSQFRQVVLRCGRRTGKTTFLQACIVYYMMRGDPVAWMGPSYSLNSEAWRGIKAMLGSTIVSSNKIEHRMEVESGGSVQFYTLNDPDAGRSRKFRLVVIDEASLVPDLAPIWNGAIQPTLLDLHGSAIMAGTPKGEDASNYFYRACTDKDSLWHHLHATSADNPYIDPELLARLERESPPLFWKQEYMAEFVSWAGKQLFRRDDLLINGDGYDAPRQTSIYAVVDTAVKDGSDHDGTAVVYFGWRNVREAGAPVLTILDYDLVRIESDLLSNWLPGVEKRMGELMTECKVIRPYAARIFIEDRMTGSQLIAHGRRVGMPVVGIPQGMTHLGKSDRALAASPFVYRQMVKLSTLARNKQIRFSGDLRNHLIAQICGFTIGRKFEHQMDLLDCFTYGVLLGCGTEDYSKSVGRDLKASSAA